MSRRRLPGAAIAGALLLAACSSDGGASSAVSTDGSIAAGTTPATTTTETSPVTTPATTLATTTTVEATSTTAAPTTTDALQGQPGVAPLTVTVAGDDPGRPTMSWTPVDGATSYELVVHDAAGAPLWAWSGADTMVVLGGVERADDAEGPTLDGGASVRVYALDAANGLVGVSAWTPAGG